MSIDYLGTPQGDIDGLQVVTGSLGPFTFNRAALPENIRNQSAQVIENYINQQLDAVLTFTDSEETPQHFFARCHVFTGNAVNFVRITSDIPIDPAWQFWS